MGVVLGVVEDLGPFGFWLALAAGTSVQVGRDTWGFLFLMGRDTWGFLVLMGRDTGEERFPLLTRGITVVEIV